MFVANLEYNTKREELLKHFSKFGEIRYFSLPRNIMDNTKNLGYCFVEYTDTKVVDKVLEARHVIRDWILRVEPSCKAEPKDMLCTIFVKNLDPSMKKDKLLEHFSQFDEVGGLSLPLNSINKTKK